MVENFESFICVALPKKFKSLTVEEQLFLASITSISLFRLLVYFVIESLQSAELFQEWLWSTMWKFISNCYFEFFMLVMEWEMELLIETSLVQKLNELKQFIRNENVALKYAQFNLCLSRF